jgi:CRISPR/Cas system CSM-associated protein Csm3 (group 7 of RAMP superfamily)
MTTRWNVHRGIVRRYLVEGWLTLETPAHFGNGDVSSFTDMPIARDTCNGSPLLTGASIAGALRAYLRRCDRDGADRLFGWVSAGDFADSLESALIVHDAYGHDSLSELRDGVAIDPKTRTAEDKKKFDIELIPADARFELCFELNIAAGEEDLVCALATALHGLETGAIGLGKRKSRGLGQCSVSSWQLCQYDMCNKAQFLNWLRDDRSHSSTGPSIAKLLAVELINPPQPRFTLSANFALDGSLLIRSVDGTGVVDRTHLHSRREGAQRPILSGTSLAGALRARALRIANTLADDEHKARQFVNVMFGPRLAKGEQRELFASHLQVRETVIENGRDDLVQSRIKIDRFTGGASDTALFDEQPVFSSPSTNIHIDLTLTNAAQGEQLEAEIGMVLLLLKDLWTGDLPLGGESSVGRGRLVGLNGEITIDGATSELGSGEGALVQGTSNLSALEKYVGTLNVLLVKEEANNAQN